MGLCVCFYFNSYFKPERFEILKKKPKNAKGKPKRKRKMYKKKKENVQVLGVKPNPHSIFNTQNSQQSKTRIPIYEKGLFFLQSLKLSRQPHKHKPKMQTS